jgi:sulfite dehydrogenase (cytochrome) subunit B
MRALPSIAAVAAVFAVVSFGAWLAVGADMPSDSWKLPAETAKLKPGPGADLVTGNCMICHSVDYISSQPPMTKAQWTGTVTKMQKKFGAPLPADKVEPIVAYLVKSYGKTN